MNGSADEADILRFLVRGFFGAGYGYGSGDSSGDGESIGSGVGFGASSGDGEGNGSGAGYGQSTGRGYGGGYVDSTGDGCGSSEGHGYGEGYGGGEGSGDGTGIKTFNKQRVFCVDGLHTIISTVHGSYARGYILLSDLTLRPIYIARVGGFFAHGYTLRTARGDAFAKYVEHRPAEQRISDFIEAHPSRTRKYAGKDLYKWHGILTGSCRAGRAAWCRDKGLDPETAKLTVKQFCELTKDAYGGDVIRQLAETMGIELK